MRKKIITGVVTALILSACGIVDNDKKPFEIALEAVAGFKLIENGKCDLGLSLLRLGEHAGQNNAPLYLAHFNAIGKCVPRNPERAFRLAAQAYDEYAGTGGFLLGYFYLNGLGVAKDQAKAAFVFREAVLYWGLLDSDFRREIASKNLFNRPVPDLLERQLDWMDEVENGPAERKYQEAIALLSPNPSPNQLRMVKHWLRDAVIGGVANAAYRLAQYYDNGLFGAPDQFRAYYYFREAARGDHVDAQLEMAKRLEKGLFVESKPLWAYYWLRRAQKNGAKVDADTTRLEKTFTDPEKFVVNDWLTKGDPGPP